MSINNNNILNAIYDWIDFSLNSQKNIGICDFVKNSNIVTGNNFISNGIIKNDGFIKLNKNGEWYKIKSIDSENQITLYNNYINNNGIDQSSFTEKEIVKIIRSETNQPAPVSDNPECPVPYITFSLLNQKKVGKSDKIEDINNEGVYFYYARYEASVTIVEVNGFGDLLNEIIEKVEHQEVIDYMQQLGLYFYRNENIIPILEETEHLFKNKHFCDVFLGYTNKTLEDLSYIDSKKIVYVNNI